MALNNNADTQQLLNPTASPAFTDLKLTNRTAYAVLTGGTTSANPLQSVASVGTSGQVLTSAGAGMLPTFANPTSLIKVTQYDANDTWTPQATTSQVQIYLWGGGGSGGSGRQGASTNAGGGGGGGAGPIIVNQLPRSIFGANATVTIGGSSTGGSAQAGANTNGNSGAIMTSTCLGNLCTPIAAGVAAQGGINGSSAGGDFLSSIYVWSAGNTLNQWDRGGGAGGGTGNGGTNVQSATLPFGTGMMPTGAGGGAGADSVTERTGGNGINVKDPSLVNTIIAGGAGGVESGTINGGNGNDQPTGSSANGMICGGTGGGGGGGQSVGASAGIGGAGGIPGGGGGGGGGSLNGTSSGAGGNGGRGRIIIVEFA